MEIARKIWSQKFRKCELDGRAGLGLVRGDDDEPVIALLYELAADFDCRKVLAPNGDEGEQRDHQAIPILNCVDLTYCAGQSRLDFIHQLLAQFEQLNARYDRTGRATNWRCRVKPRLEGLEPSPIGVRHHDPGGFVKEIDLGSDGIWRVGLGQVPREFSDALCRKAFARIFIQRRRFLDRQEPEEPTPTEEVAIPGCLGEATTRCIVKRIVAFDRARPKVLVGLRPLVIRQM